MEAYPNLCGVCGISDMDVLCVHHIDMVRTNNLISNLVVLCYNCHSIVHKEIKRRFRETEPSKEICHDVVRTMLNTRNAEVKLRNEAGTLQRESVMGTRTEPVEQRPPEGQRVEGETGSGI